MAKRVEQGKSSASDQITFEALRQFAEDVKVKLSALAAGEPEDQLRSPFENFLVSVSKALTRNVVAKGESLLKGRLGRPDYAVLVEKILAGYVELKEVGKGANPDQYKGHDRNQWKRFQNLPNLIYTDGNEWGLYREGQRIGELVQLTGDISKSGKSAVKPEDAHALKPLITDFLNWDPIVPKGAKALAELIAPLCRLLRQEASDAVKDEKSRLIQLASDWRQLLFPDADDDRFADAYAQTVTFALLLARSEDANVLDEDLHQAIQKLSGDHSLLSRALQVLTDKSVREEIAPSLHMLQRVIQAMPVEALKDDGKRDPWLYFYEDFLAAYDPQLRKEAGAYYTPVGVVQAQVRLIDNLLTQKLNKAMGFADESVVTLDPAVGTGTYLLGVIDHAMNRIAEEQGQGAIPPHATRLAKNIFGFEIMVGPYSVSELRLSRDLLDRGASLPKDGLGIYLTDTLESPHANPPKSGLFYEPLAEQHKRALKVKDCTPVLVCLGNPPYLRHEAADAKDATSRARSGGWVRWSNDGKTDFAIFRDFLQPALDSGHGGDVKNLYNLYVYFWRWALWKVFEHTSTAAPGIVSFISASSYIDGDAFVGMREHMRRLCDDIWIIDLGGEGRGTRKEENVFSIQTPVAIAIAACYSNPDTKKSANVHYSRLSGTRAEKLAILERVTDFKSIKWQKCPKGWQSPFRPAGKGSYFDWPLLTDLMPWQHSGVQLKRTWPIAPNEETLKHRWHALLSEIDRGKAFKESGDRLITKTYGPLLPDQEQQKPIRDLDKNEPAPPILRYSYRSFDRQWIIADGRVMSRPRPELWRIHSERQVYLSTSFQRAIDKGPALTTGSHVIDLNHFCNRGAKDSIPLYRDVQAQNSNILPGLLDLLGKEYKHKIDEEDFLAYIYALLAHASFTEQFQDELVTRELRVPLTKDHQLFQRASEIGEKLLWLHTYGQRFADKSRPKGKIPRGKARCTKPVSEKSEEYPDSFEFDASTKRLLIGNGEFEPVSPEVFEFDVSGLKVVQSWLGYRMKIKKGKKSSPLDFIGPKSWTAQFTTELLGLLWVLEATLETYPEQEELLNEVLEGPLFTAAELPEVPDEARVAPKEKSSELSLFDEENGEDE